MELNNVKKERHDYVKPCIETIEVNTEGILCSSIVSSGRGKTNAYERGKNWNF